MWSAIFLFLSGLVVLFLLVTWDLWTRVLKPIHSPSPLLDLKGPRGGYISTGQLAGKPCNGLEPDIWFLRVFERYGSVTVVRAPWNTCMLWTCDHKALNHVLSNSHLYHRPDNSIWWFGTFVGRGIVIAHGDEHSRQRRIMNPAFGITPIRDMTKIFVDKSWELCDIVRTLIPLQRQKVQQPHTQIREGEKSGGGADDDDWTVIDLSPWLGRAAVDMMSLACFHYPLDSLNAGLLKVQAGGVAGAGSGQGDEGDELYPALEELFGVAKLNFPLLYWKSWIPLLRLWTFDQSARKVNHFHSVVRTLSKKMIREREKEIREGILDEKARDLLTLLVKAKMEKDNKSKMMSQNEIYEQISSFFVAGHEASAAAVVWGLHSFTHDLAIQNRLREELDSLETDRPTMEELNSLPYLDLVVKETLRLHSPGAWIEREATIDDVIPFEKPFEDRHGNVRQQIAIHKGDQIRISIRSINCQEEVWGPDAREFNPERWRDPPKAAATMPGVIGNQISFSAGPKGCIGFRFGTIEMKAMIFTLIRTFEFEPAVPKETVLRRSLAVSRPVLKGQIHVGSQLPLRVRVRRTGGGGH